MNNHTQSTNQPSPFFHESTIDFNKIFGELYQYKWIILAVSVCTFLIFFIHATLNTQIVYQTTSLMKVNTQTTNDNVLNSLGYKSSSSSSIDTQSALMKTRYILEPVVLKKHLNITAAPRYFPIFGRWAAKRYRGENIAKPFLGLRSYNWGGEEILVKHFVVPKTLLGHSFRLVAGQANTYRLYSSQGALIFSGKNGQRINSDGIELEIILNANPDAEFTISYQSPIPVAKQLANKLQITHVLGISAAQGTGIIQLQLIDPDPNKAVSILNSIMQYTVAKSVLQKMLETQKTLVFLNKRLPELKSNLSQAEAAVNQYHMARNILTMTIVRQILLSQLTNLERAIEKIKIQKEELLQIYTPLHPFIIAIMKKEEQLQKKYIEVRASIKKFPNENQIEINLIRDVRIKNLNYLSLLSRSQQLEIAKAGLIPDIIALTDATPASALPTNKILRSLLGLLCGAFLSIMVIVTKSMLTKTVETSEQLEDELRIPVQSIIPFSRKQKQLEKIHEKSLSTFGSALTTPLILAKQNSDDISVESLRSLRISLSMSTGESGHHVIATMGSLSNIGKSFVSLNLSQVIADTGRRTLLIDADIRRGKLHHALLQPRSNGLSEYLEEKCTYETIVRSISENFYSISCGTHTKHPLELFQSPRFLDLITTARKNFDQIIIDTPPILAVADSIIIAQHCDIKLFVVSATKDSITDVKNAIKRAHFHGININGFILNYRRPLLPYGQHYYYRYSYTTTT